MVLQCFPCTFGSVIGIRVVTSHFFPFIGDFTVSLTRFFGYIFHSVSMTNYDVVLFFRNAVFLAHGRRQDPEWTIICGVPGTYSSADSKQNDLKFFAASVLFANGMGNTTDTNVASQ